MEKRLNRDFFARDPKVVAPDLLGKLLVRKDGKKVLVGKIVETEAYLGYGDAASHSHKGMTKRNVIMFGPAGHAYVYFTYGIHWMLNFVTESEGKPSAVLVRALEPIYDPKGCFKIVAVAPKAKKNYATNIDPIKLANGPAKLTKWLRLDGAFNNVDVTSSEDLFITDEVKVGKEIFRSQKIERRNIVATERVGIDYAGEHKKLPLRFYLRDNNYVSKK